MSDIKCPGFETVDQVFAFHREVALGKHDYKSVTANMSRTPLLWKNTEIPMISRYLISSGELSPKALKIYELLDDKSKRHIRGHIDNSEFSIRLPADTEPFIILIGETEIQAKYYLQGERVHFQAGSISPTDIDLYYGNEKWSRSIGKFTTEFGDDPETLYVDKIKVNSEHCDYYRIEISEARGTVEFFVKFPWRETAEPISKVEFLQLLDLLTEDRKKKVNETVKYIVACQCDAESCNHGLPLLFPMFKEYL